MYIYKAAVVGAGVMGAQIAQVISYSGLPVILKDLTEEKVQKGLAVARRIYQGRVEKGKMTAEEMEKKLLLISGTVRYEDFSDVDIVIEAAFEDLGVKQSLFRELDEVCPRTAILASNTSALSISALGAATRRPEKVVGMHFFNPAHVMKLVEVIPGVATSSETVDDVVSFAEGLRKIPIRVSECPGFLVNRLLMPYLNEAAYALQEGAGSRKEIDEAMVAFGLPMGPFALCDMIGIDVGSSVAQILHEAFGPRMEPARIFFDLMVAGRVGTKSGAGFYLYEEGRTDDLDHIITRIQKEGGQQGTRFSVNRLLLPMVNEAVICLQEGVASAADIDLAMVAGTGFPQEKGGPLHWADQIGIDRVCEELGQLKRELGIRFWPAPMLKRMEAAGRLGVKTGRGFFSYG